MVLTCTNHYIDMPSIHVHAHKQNDEKLEQ